MFSKKCEKIKRDHKISPRELRGAVTIDKPKHAVIPLALLEKINSKFINDDIKVLVEKQQKVQKLYSCLTSADPDLTKMKVFISELVNSEAQLKAHRSAAFSLFSGARKKLVGDKKLSAGGMFIKKIVGKLEQYPAFKTELEYRREEKEEKKKISENMKAHSAAVPSASHNKPGGNRK